MSAHQDPPFSASSVQLLKIPPLNLPLSRLEFKLPRSRDSHRRDYETSQSIESQATFPDYFLSD